MLDAAEVQTPAEFLGSERLVIEMAGTVVGRPASGASILEKGRRGRRRSADHHDRTPGPGRT